MRQKMVDMVHQLQDIICDALKEIDGSTYREDSWQREEGGGGRSRVFSDGNVFEKAGVNVSVVHGTLRPEAARAMGGGQQLGDEDLDSLPQGSALCFILTTLTLRPFMPITDTSNEAMVNEKEVGGLEEEQI